MTKAELFNKFESGEQLMVYFTRNCSYTLGGKNITFRQFTSITTEYKGRYDFKIVSSGFTKHYYTYKSN